MRMRTKLLPCLAAALAVGAISAPAASAATEVGSNCAATSAVANYTILQLSQAGGAPLAAPAAGVVTKWKVNSALLLPFTPSQKLRVFRATGVPNEFQTITESSLGAIQTGANTFETNIPIQAGDRFGVFSPAGPTSLVFICPTTSTEDKLGIKEGDVPPGAKATYTPIEKNQLALSVTIEPDADGDGFGDETQDKCPRSAKLQTECPLISLSSFGIASRNSALMLVASSSSVPVTVAATVTVPGKAKKGKKGKAKILKLTGGAQTVGPGQLARFVVAYSVPLKAALTALSPKKSLTLTVSASAIDATGLASSSATTLRLKGQAKPKK
jgi:hypothetical protein